VSAGLSRRCGCAHAAMAVRLRVQHNNVMQQARASACTGKQEQRCAALRVLRMMTAGTSRPCVPHRWTPGHAVRQGITHGWMLISSGSNARQHQSDQPPAWRVEAARPQALCHSRSPTYIDCPNRWLDQHQLSRPAHAAVQMQHPAQQLTGSVAPVVVVPAPPPVILVPASPPVIIPAPTPVPAAAAAVVILPAGHLARGLPGLLGHHHLGGSKGVWA
jgi:hypothetical protein